MADIPSSQFSRINPFANITDVGSLFWSTAPPDILGNISFLVTIGKAIGIAIIAYIAFRIVQSIVMIRQALRTKTMAAEIAEINTKLDILLGKKLDKSEKSDKEEKKKK